MSVSFPTATDKVQDFAHAAGAECGMLTCCVRQDWVHWIYTDARGKHLSQGKTVLPYNGPTPPEGVHHYHVSLYSQPAELANAKAPESRCQFSPSEFAAANCLTLIADRTFKVAAGTE